MNIALYRITALIYRHILVTWRAFPRIIDLLYWPLVNIILWGFTSIDFQNNLSNEKFLFAVMTVLIFWQVMFRVNMEISANIFDELLSHNFANVMATPATIFEMLCAVICIGTIKAMFAGLYGAFFSWLFYGIWFFDIGYTVIPFFIMSVLSGIFIGLITIAAIIYWGQKTQPLIWVIAWAFTLFSGIFYRVDVFPPTIQTFCWFIPMTHLFSTIRSYCLTGMLLWSILLQTFLLNNIYVVGAGVIFWLSYRQSKKLGLARLDRYE